MKQTYSVPTVPAIIDNLNSNTLSADATLSNAQKSAQRVLWFKEAIKQNGLTQFLVVLEQTINSLPEGDKKVVTAHPVTGVKGSKTINYRSIAKSSFTTAYGHAVKGNDKLESTKLAWHLSQPKMDEKAAPATLEKRIASLLKESVDKAGLTTIMQTISNEQLRHKTEVVELTANHEAMLRRTRLINDIAAVMQRGNTEESVIMAKAAMLNDLTVEELKAAIA